MQLVVPARIPAGVRERVRELAVRRSVTTGCAGLARVDFFVVGDEVLVNELNTMPGFTQHERVRQRCSTPAGSRTPELLDRLVELALRAPRGRARPHRLLSRRLSGLS